MFYQLQAGYSQKAKMANNGGCSKVSSLESSIIKENYPRILASLQQGDVLFQVASEVIPEQASAYKDPEKAGEFVNVVLEKIERDPGAFLDFTLSLSTIVCTVPLAEELNHKREVVLQDSNDLNPVPDQPDPEASLLPIPVSGGLGGSLLTPWVETLEYGEPTSTGVDRDQDYVPPTQETVHTSELVCGASITKEFQGYQSDVKQAKDTLVLLRAKVDQKRSSIGEKRYSIFDDEIEQQRRSVHEHLDKVTGFKKKLGELKTECMESQERAEGSVEKLEEKVEGLEDKVEGLEDKVEGLEDMVDGLEQEVGSLQKRLQVSRKKSLEQISILEDKVDGLEQEVDSLQKKLQVSRKESLEQIGILELSLKEVHDRLMKEIKESRRSMKIEVDPKVEELKNKVDAELDNSAAEGEISQKSEFPVDEDDESNPRGKNCCRCS